MKQNLTVEFAKANFGKKLSYIAPGYTNKEELKKELKKVL